MLGNSGAAGRPEPAPARIEPVQKMTGRPTMTTIGAKHDSGELYRDNFDLNFLAGGTVRDRVA
jgi:hypothetical protein